MKLERIDKDDKELFDKVCSERVKYFGFNTGGYWYCSHCQNQMTSFLRSFEYHIPEVCPRCDVGSMIENESEREKPTGSAFIRGKKGEDAWLSKQPPHMQADILLGRDPEY